MKTFVLTIISLLLTSCSSKPELDQIIDEVLGHRLSSGYQIVSYSRSPGFLDYLGKYNDSYAIQLNKQDYLDLISKTQGSWTLQPSSTNSYKRWERIAKIRKYELIGISSFDTNSRIINVHISE